MDTDPRVRLDVIREILEREMPFAPDWAEHCARRVDDALAAADAVDDGWEPDFGAAGIAMLALDEEEDDEGPSLFEWHRCPECPLSDTIPCPCSGIPWPSEIVRAGIVASSALTRVRRSVTPPDAWLTRRDNRETRRD